MDRLKEIPVGATIELTSKEESIELSELLDSNDYKWALGEKLTETNNWDAYKGNTIYVINDNKLVTFAHKKLCRNLNQVLTLEEFKQKYMETKELKVEVPEGYEIDRENSTFECIKFKPKSLTYEDVANNLFSKHNVYFVSSFGEIRLGGIRFSDPNNATSQKQLEKLLAINKMLNVAKYLNANWIPDWNDAGEDKYYIRINVENKNRLEIKAACCFCISFVYFKSGELTQQAIDILGEDTVRLACSTDW